MLTLVFGIWLSLSGKPYNGFLFNIHKLIALGSVVASAFQLYRLLMGSQVQTFMLILIIMAGMCLLALFFSGAMMSAGKLDYQGMLTTHRIALIILTLGLVGILYLLTGKKLASQ